MALSRELLLKAVADWRQWRNGDIDDAGEDWFDFQNDHMDRVLELALFALPIAGSAPKAEGLRVESIRIRATAGEKASWSSAAKRDGRTVSDWLRNLGNVNSRAA